MKSLINSKAKKYSIWIIATVICFISCSSLNTKINNDILHNYYKNKIYAKNQTGRFIKSIDKQMYKEVKSRFYSADTLIIIEQFCNWRNLNGLIWQTDSNKVYFNVRNNNIEFYIDNENIKSYFYNKIILLLKKDSLSFYSNKAYNNIFLNETECYLKINEIIKEKIDTPNRSFVFHDIYAFSRDIIGY